MSESTLKLIGLGIMIVSVFAMLFSGTATDGMPEFAGTLVSWLGFIALVAGLVLYVAAKGKEN